ncbi:MAG TPA: thioredoxin domain-containing protein [Steroidobacteraceae bacterium]|nr:thioredoxin domain-containing protein [Steroidobacteraceae bacterium]
MDSPQGKNSNRLAGETSPYLQQHATNPVDWRPWGSEALELARTSGKPILLSIGYSACHWCHVMAHESFEDSATASLMNEHFVNIKVDREERPDIDKIYQFAHQVLTQRGGGWPLTMFLTHDDQKPFFGGTYFPDKARYGMPAFTTLLKRVAEYYRDQRDELRAQNATLMDVFGDLTPAPVDATFALDRAPLDGAREQLNATFDKRYGGFGDAPKFPHPGSIDRLLRHWHSTAVTQAPDLHALYMATLTLTRMGEGGMYDQLGGGFSRYSVDQFWMIPHFEKMLYDNGALLATYAEAALATGDEFFRRIAGETGEWLLREMQDASSDGMGGGFYSAYDADSEGHEGKFYVWTRTEVRAALTPLEWNVFSRRFGFDEEPNFEGAWHTHVFVSFAEIAKELQLEVSAVESQVGSARKKLLTIRSQRVWPGLDDKILTSWNALAIRGLAIAARTLDRPDLGAAAERALAFIRANLWRNGRLLATSKDGISHLNAYLDDYAYLAHALLEMLQLRWRNEDVAWLREVLDAMLAHFEDARLGGFFFTSDDHETLIHRSKSFSDDAIPSGNGIAARALIRAGYLLGESRWLTAAERTLRAAWLAINRFPHGHMSLLEALAEYLGAPEIVIIREPAEAAGSWQRELGKLYAPHRLVFSIPANATGLDAAIADKKAGTAARAYVCRGATCSAPVESIGDLVRIAQARV